jgi:hypothetical protein
MAQMPAQEEEDPEFKPQYHKKLVKKASLWNIYMKQETAFFLIQLIFWGFTIS